MSTGTHEGFKARRVYTRHTNPCPGGSKQWYDWDSGYHWRELGVDLGGFRGLGQQRPEVNYLHQPLGGME